MSDPQGPKPEDTASSFGESFDQVFKEELDCLGHRWESVYRDPEKPDEPQTVRSAPRPEPTTDNELVGLAFSGGGIRSATINMGIAQALHSRGVFDHVDYMSTVSGGGYLGSSISTAMRELGPGDKGEFPYAYQDPEAAEPGKPQEVESKFLTWVRNNSNYMATGDFLDWPRIFGVLLRGMLANFLVLMPILLALAVGLVWFHGDKLANWEAYDQQVAEAREEATRLAGEFDQAERRAAGADERTQRLADAAQERAKAAEEEVKALGYEAPKVSKYFRVALSVAGIFLLLVLIFPVMIRVYKVYQHGKKVESTVESRGRVEKAFGIVLVMIFVAAAAELLPLLIRWFHQVETSGLRGLYAGAGSGGALAIFTAAGKFLSKLGGLKQKIALFLVGLLGLVIPLVVALYVADDLIYIHPEAGPNAVAEARAFAAQRTPAYLVTAYHPMEFTKPFGEGGWVRLLPGILLIIMGGGLGAAGVGKILTREKKKEGKPREPGFGSKILVFFGILVGAAFGYAVLVGSSQALARLCGVMGIDGIRPDALVLSMAVVVMVFCWAAIDVNLTAVLGLYRDRLAAAYLIGVRKKTDENGQETGEEEVFIEPDLDLEELCGGISPEEKTRRPGERPEGTSHCPCKPSKAPYHIVNTALNLQGSSDPMLRDRGSDFFMFSKLYYGGHRTGYCETWRLEKVFPQMDLPTAMAISAAAASPNAGRMTSKPLVALMTLLNVRLGYWVPHPGRLFDWLQERKLADPKLLDRWGWRIPPRALLKEMASAVNEEDRWVNLSDGGHIENMAVYELLRRRCKYIICGDGEADPTLSFGGLATLMRSARIDMGIEIEILLDDLHLGDDGTSHQHAALGIIKYPPLEPGGEKESGYLLYIKSSFTGNEDETMQEYRAKSPDFPHETTADQFFDEGQFEAYRALGFHMADGLFPPRGNGVPKVGWEGFKEWFEKLQADLAPRLSAKHVSLQKQLRRISKLLLRKQYRSYFYELHPKLDDRTAAQTKQDSENKAMMPEMTYLVGLQLDLMENAFLSLDLDQPVNWNHPGNQGWKRLFTAWTEDSEQFKRSYCFLRHLRSGRFQNFCERTLKLPSETKCEEEYGV